MTDSDLAYTANPKLIIDVTARCVQIADMLRQPTPSLPLLGTGDGGAQAAEVIRGMLNAVFDQIPRCEHLRQLSFSIMSRRMYATFTTRVLVVLLPVRQ